MGLWKSNLTKSIWPTPASQCTWILPVKNAKGVAFKFEKNTCTVSVFDLNYSSVKRNGRQNQTLPSWDCFNDRLKCLPISSSVKRRICVVFIEISIYCLSQREHGWHSRPPCATCCGQDGNPLVWEVLSLTWPLITAGWRKTAARGCVDQGCAAVCAVGPARTRRVPSRAAGQRGRGAGWRKRCGTARERCGSGAGAGAARHPTATGGLHFPSKGALPGAVFPGKRLVSANESPAVLLPRLSVCC